MGQSLSLCGSRSRPSRSPSLSCESHLPSSSPHFAPLSYHPSTKKGLYEVKDNEDGLCALYPTTSHTELQLIDSDDDDCVDVPHLKYSVKHRSARPGHALSAALSSYPSESSLDNSPVYSDHAAYYTTDDDNSPLSSLSAQGSPDRLTTASSSSSHTIQVIRPSSDSSVSFSSNSSLSVHSSLPLAPPHHRSLTTSASSSSLSRSVLLASTTFHHSRSLQELNNASSHPVAVFPSSSAHGPSVHHSMELSTPSPPPAPSCVSVADSRPIVTRNAVISIRPSISSSSLSSLASNSTRTFRTHRKPLSLSPPSPHVQSMADDVESPDYLPSRSLFTFHPAQELAVQLAAPVGCQGTVMHMLRAM